MGYKIGNYKGNNSFYNAKQILCDTFNDLIIASSEIDCGAGSKAIILDSSEVYIKNTAGEWKKQNMATTGGDIDPSATYIYDGGLII